MDKKIKYYNIMPGKREYKLPKNVYCGGEKLPEGKKYGTLSQCSNAGQIRLYNKADQYNNAIIPTFKNLLDYNGKIANETGDIKVVKQAFRVKEKLNNLKDDLKRSEKTKSKSFKEEAEENKKDKERNAKKLDKYQKGLQDLTLRVFTQLTKR